MATRRLWLPYTAADDAGGQYPQMQIEGVRVLVGPADEASARRLLAAADDIPRRPVNPRSFGDGGADAA
jgi:hypothetical protein